jgi:ketosteroid isomerase-like protein
MKLLNTLGLLTLLLGCQTTPLLDTGPLGKELLEADRAFAALSERSNPKTAFAAYMAPDGLILPRGSVGAVEGLEQVLAALGEGDDPGYRLLWQPQFAEVAAGGDMGWTWGQYQVLAEGETISTGKYLNVWTRQADGRWKVRADIGNQRPAPTSTGK